MNNKRTAFGYISYSMIYFFYFFAMGMFGSMLSVYLAGMEKSSSQISVIVSGSGIFSMVLGPVIGIWYDKTGWRKKLSLILLAASAITGLLFATTKNTILLFLCNGFAMAFLGGVNPVCEQIASSSPFRYGVVRLWGAVGYAVATQAAGLILEAGHGKMLFVIFAIGALLTGLAFHLTGLKDSDAPAKAAKEEEASIRSVLSLPMILFAIYSFLFNGLTSASGTYVPILMQNLMGSSSKAGTILFIGTLMEIPIIFLSDRFMDKLSGRALLAINTVLLLVQLMAYSFISDVTLVSVILILTKSVTTMLAIMVTLKCVLILTGGRYATTALSVIGTVKAIGGVVLTNMAGLWIDAHSLNSVFRLLTILTVMTLVFSFFIHIPKGENSYFTD